MNWYKKAQEFQEFIIKFSPNRAENLRNIADWIQENYNREEHNQLWGYAEQIGIIADEIESKIADRIKEKKSEHEVLRWQAMEPLPEGYEYELPGD